MKDIELLKQASEESVNNRIDEASAQTDESGWKIVKKDGKDYRMKTFIYGKVTVNTYRPILTDEERTRREKQIMNAIGKTLIKYDNLDAE